MLKVLVKKQVLELYRSYFIDRKTNKLKTKKQIIGFIVLLLLLFGSLGFAFYEIAGSIGMITLNNDLHINWLYFSLLGLISIALGVFGSVFNTYSSLYLPKDNEQLLSLPIEPKNIVLSRILGVYVVSLMYTAWIWIPSIICYYVLTPLTITRVLFPFIMTFILSLFVTILSCILGFIVALIAKKSKNNNFLKIFFSLFIMVAYYVVYFNIVDKLNNITEYILNIQRLVQSNLKYIYYLGEASDGKLVPFVIIVSITLILFYLCYFIITKSFIKLADNNDTKTKNKNKEVIIKTNNMSKSLIKREFKHFFSVSSWVLNGGLGFLILPFAAIYLIIKKATVLAVLTEMKTEIPLIINSFPVIIICILCFVIFSGCILSISISLEGKTLWILKTLPIDTKEILKSKERMYYIISIIPVLIFTLVVLYVFNINLIQSILVLLISITLILFNGDFGLFLDLKEANFNWINESMIIKQSIQVMINLFGGWGIMLLIGFIGVYLTKLVNIYISLIIIFVIFFVLYLLLHNYLMKKGIKEFNTL